MPVQDDVKRLPVREGCPRWGIWDLWLSRLGGGGCGSSRFGDYLQGGSGAPKTAPCPFGGNLNDAGGCLYLMCGPGRLLAGTEAFLAGGTTEHGGKEDLALLKTRPGPIDANRRIGRTPLCQHDRPVGWRGP